MGSCQWLFQSSDIVSLSSSVLIDNQNENPAYELPKHEFLQSITDKDNWSSVSKPSQNSKIAEFKVSATYLLLETSLHIIYKQGVNYFCSSRDTIKLNN